MQVSYGIQTYSRLDLPAMKLVNLFVEQVPEKIVPGNLVLAPRPGMTSRATLGTGPIRGLFFQPGKFDGKIFTVSGTHLYAGDTDIGALTIRDSAQMTVLNATLLIAVGAFYRSDGATVAPIAFPDDQDVSSVISAGGYAFASAADSRRIYFTLDPTTWDGLDYFSAEQSTDEIMGLAVVVDQIWVFCRRHVEVFFLTGDADAPAQRVQGRLFDKGADRRDTIVKLDNTVFWIGNDGIVYRAEGNPVRISDHGIEDRLRDANAAYSAFTCGTAGHLFYVVSLPTETLAYDVATRQWTQFATGEGPWAPTLAILYNQIYVMGDGVNGNLYNFRDDTNLDAGAPIIRYFTVMLNSPGIVDNITFNCSTATPSPGTAEIRVSRDAGRSWGGWRPTPLGSSARTRVRFNRLGMVDQENMIIQARLTGAISPTVRTVTVNDTGGGLSR